MPLHLTLSAYEFACILASIILDLINTSNSCWNVERNESVSSSLLQVGSNLPQLSIQVIKTLGIQGFACGPCACNTQLCVLQGSETSPPPHNWMILLEIHQPNFVGLMSRMKWYHEHPQRFLDSWNFIAEGTRRPNPFFYWEDPKELSNLYKDTQIVINWIWYLLLVLFPKPHG